MAKISINRASAGVTLDVINFRDLIGMKIDVASPTELKLYAGGSGFLNITFSGSGFTYDSNQQLVGGVINNVEYSDFDLNFTIKEISIPGAGAMSWLLTNTTQTVFSTILAGDDIVDAYFGGDDVLRGYGGNDGLYGAAGADSLFGGEGDDTLSGAIDGPPGTETNFLRGEEGNDLLLGGPGFDDLHGNMGNDTVKGAGGADWVVGGKGEDLLFGDGSRDQGTQMANPDGGDIVYGNMGHDTCYGGDGADTLRGGQDNDTLAGEAGNDWLSGDRGDDTLSGGAGADTFYVFAGSGADRIVDFSAAQGDRIQFEPGLKYLLRQQGADTVVELGGGDQVTLMGVDSSSLTGAWSFFAAS